MGRAGNALTDALLADEDARGAEYVAEAVAIDTDAGDLNSLDRVEEQRRHLLGAVHTDGEGTAGDANLAPFARFGDDMEQFVLDQVDDIAELSARISQ